MGNAYQALGRLILTRRMSAGIANQSDFSRLVKRRQQTVSRWERGESRPRPSDLLVIADVLSADPAELLAAAGYAQPVAAATYDRPFPLSSLSSDSFERFALHLLAACYPSAKVHPAGKAGHKQYGVDIEVLWPDGRVWTFQCKREQQFGPANVARAIAVHTRPADMKVILLSRVASPEARAEGRGHSDWDIWDQEDISRLIRSSLSKAQQLDLVDTFFRGQRLALLGETEAGPWQSTDRFFAPFLAEGRVFNHRWKLVGRDEELAKLAEALSDSDCIVATLVGKAGGGKSRLLYETLQNFQRANPTVLVRVLSPTEEVTAKSLEDLGRGAKLLVVDDAHDRDDLPLLINYAADPESRARLLIVIRPYALDVLSRDLAGQGLTGELVHKIELRPASKSDATVLAAQVLQELSGPAHAAAHIAEVAFDSPLAIVIGAQIVAKDGLHPELFGSHDAFRSTVLKRYEKVVYEDIATGVDQDRIRRILRVLALVQPVFPDDRPTLDLLRSIEGIDSADATRLTKRLVEAGALLKRGVQHRLSPDLLADSIIESACMTSDGRSNGYAERVFDACSPEQMEHLLLNLGKLDWRRNEGDTSRSQLLDGLWSRLEWRDDHSNPHVQAAAAAAYYQPRQAITFAARLIREGRRSSDALCRILKNAAHNLVHVSDACALLWELGLSDSRATHQHPDHPIRILTELATPDPQKPTEFVEAVVDFVLSVVEVPDSWRGRFTPYSVLEGALATEGHFTSAATRRRVTLSAYGVDHSAMKGARQRIVDELLSSLSSPNGRRAFTAAKTLGEAIRGPHGILNRRPTSEEQRGWEEEFASTLKRIDEVVERDVVSAPVLVGVAESVAWYAFHRKPEDTITVLANRILGRLDRDLRTRTARVLLDGWGHKTWPLDSATHKRPAHEEAMEALTGELLNAYPDVTRFADYLTQCLQEIERTADEEYGAPHVYINRLIFGNPPIAREVLRISSETANVPLGRYAGVALGTLLRNVPEEGHARVAKLLEAGDEHLQLIVQAYVYLEADALLSDENRSVLKKLFNSANPSVLRYVPHITREIARTNATVAIDLLVGGNPVAALQVGDEYFMWLADENTIPFALIKEEQLARLVKALASTKSLDGHWISAFLKKAMQRSPHLVVDLAKARIEFAVANDNWEIEPLDSGYRHGASLHLLNHADGATTLRALLDWALVRVQNGLFAYRFGQLVDGLCGPYDSAFVAVLESWLTSGGTTNHVRVAATVLRDAHEDLIFTHSDFVERALSVARRFGADAHRAMSSAIFAATVSGGRAGVPGEPFPADLRLLDYAEQKLAATGKHGPTYELFSELAAHAKSGIERQRREKAALDAEEEA
jgi:transcriptional regulator with XRE-family HTH domain